MKRLPRATLKWGKSNLKNGRANGKGWKLKGEKGKVGRKNEGFTRRMK
jgi:hypothetical protein